MLVYVRMSYEFTSVQDEDMDEVFFVAYGLPVTNISEFFLQYSI